MLHNVSHASVHCASARSADGTPVQGDVWAESSIAAPNVLSPRTVLVHCTIARSENGTPVQGSVWLARQPMLRTPVLCVKPLNDPIECIFFKTLEMPERDAMGFGWKLVSKTKVNCKADEFKSEIIRLYPITSQTSDQQLDDAVAAIREFRAQALATAEAERTGLMGPTIKSDFQHLLSTPDEMSRNELPEYFTRGNVPAPEVRSSPPVCPQFAEERLHRTQYFAVPDDVYFCINCEDLAAAPLSAQGYGNGLASTVSALPSLPPQSDEELSETSSSENDEAWTLPVSREWQLSNPECITRRLSSWEWRMVKSAWYSWLHFHQDLQQWHSTGTVIEDSESDCDLPRASTQDFRLDSASCSDDSSIEGDYESYDGSETYSDCSYDSFEAPDWYFHDHDSYFEHLSTSDSVPPPCTRNSWRSACHITIDEADLDGTWELPSLTASDCGGELELIRYTVCTSAIAFEDSAAAAIS